MNLTDYIDRGARVAPTAPCMSLPDGTTLSTHAEFHRLTHRIATALLSDGLEPGERVAIFSPNDADAFACIVGAIRAGGVWIPVNVASRRAEITGFLDLTGCTRLIYHGSLAAHVSILLELVPSIVTVVSIGPGRPDRSCPTGSVRKTHARPTCPPTPPGSWCSRRPAELQALRRRCRSATGNCC